MCPRVWEFICVFCSMRASLHLGVPVVACMCAHAPPSPLQVAYVGDAKDVVVEFSTGDVRRECADIIGGRKGNRVASALTQLPADMWRCEVVLQVGLLHPLRDERMWLSAPAPLSIVDTHRAPPDVAAAVVTPLSGSGSGATAHAHTPQAGLASQAGDVPARTPAPPPLAGAVSVLALGCFRGSVPTPGQAQGVVWRRMYDPVCDNVTVASPQEWPRVWMSGTVAPAAVWEPTVVAAGPGKAMADPLTGSSDIVLYASLMRDEPRAHTPPPVSGNSTESCFARTLQHGGAASGGGVTLPHSHTPPASASDWEEWRMQEHTTLLSHMQAGSQDAITVHWGLFMLSDPLPFLHTAHTLLKPGGIIRIVEPDYRYTQLYLRRYDRLQGGGGTVTTPSFLTAGLTQTGFLHVTLLAPDETTCAGPSALCQSLPQDTLDAVDVQLWAM